VAGKVCVFAEPGGRMTVDEKLAAILAAVQTDPGHRGLARDPHDNLFTATAGDFQAACWSIVDDTQSCLGVVTGFSSRRATHPPLKRMVR
jgi:D-glutamate cyclase